MAGLLFVFRQRSCHSQAPKEPWESPKEKYPLGDCYVASLPAMTEILYVQ